MIDEVSIGIDNDCIEFWRIVSDEVLIAFRIDEQWLKEVLTDSDCIDWVLNEWWLYELLLEIALSVDHDSDCIEVWSW